MAVHKLGILATLTWLFASSVSSAATGIRDPFATLSNAPEVPDALALTDSAADRLPQNLQLRAILWGRKPLANISGMIVAEGDRVHDFTVLQLSRKTAVLNRAGESILLVLEEAH